MSAPLCTCKHPKTSHGPRVSRGKPHRDVASGCLAGDCLCESFTPRGEKTDILPPASRAEIELIERKLKGAIALCEEGLNRLRELKAQ